MGMSIDEAKNYLLDVSIDDGSDDNMYEYIISIMDKYQKIKDLVDFYTNAGEIPILALKGIIEDGKID